MKWLRLIAGRVWIVTIFFALFCKSRYFLKLNVLFSIFTNARNDENNIKKRIDFSGLDLVENEGLNLDLTNHDLRENIDDFLP